MNTHTSILAQKMCDAVGELGSLERYIAVVNRYPLLSLEEELELATRVQHSHDLHAARLLVLSHLRVVVRIAREYLGYGLPHADLIQEGTIGLMKAVRRFDPTRNVRLVSFSIHWIKAEIREFIVRNWRVVKIATTKTKRCLFFNLQRLKKNLGVFSHDEAVKIAETLRVSVTDVIDVHNQISQPDTYLCTETEDAGLGPMAVDHTQEPSHVLVQQQERHFKAQTMRRALSTLDHRSYRIIEARWLQEQPLTLHELANEWDISTERVRQIEKTALKKMKATIQAQQDQEISPAHSPAH